MKSITRQKLVKPSISLYLQSNEIMVYPAEHIKYGVLTTKEIKEYFWEINKKGSSKGRGGISSS